MTHYDPDLFKNKRLSEQLLEAAKQRLDELGDYENLKKELDQAFQEKTHKKQPVKDGAPSKKGWMI